MIPRSMFRALTVVCTTPKLYMSVVHCVMRTTLGNVRGAGGSFFERVGLPRGSVNSGGKLAHIGGAFFGYFYTVNLRQGHDIGKGFNRIIDFFVRMFKPRRILKVTHKKVATEYEYNKVKAERQKLVNKILDKISKGGYDSLTREEKETLFKESQKKN